MHSLLTTGLFTALIALVTSQQYNRFGQAYPYQGNNQAWNGGNDNQYGGNDNNNFGGGNDFDYGGGGNNQFGRSGNEVAGVPCTGFELAMTYIPDEQDCHSFYRCALPRMNKVQFKCPDNQVFDKNYHNCRTLIPGEC
ncbi:hypothetical protein LOTGIDRAFT_235223 [Lottia gigantea]|uniref:Chitin-binding type-2 domain-containing protein n=1 Tax=Lottia gigantea TaxID=225164 RepID=V3Z7K1_LOTGI|nr:hypothetical protein LOTGIDRAFT_235223 [Lottia gigantea]ESO86823.1 hypothetical protein LOTGIDRAFT_235223 [Lottia gigantea]